MNFMIKKLILILLITSFNEKIFAADIEDKITRLNWNGVEVVWLEDDRLPLYQIVVYFADGALSDDPKQKGETQAMFGLIDKGTRRYDQKSIVENLEYYGAEYGGSVYHESSSYLVSGMVKDVIPTMKQICHLFRDATFPKKEIKKTASRLVSGLQNIKSNPQELISRVFREISLSGSPFSYPTGGKIKDIKKIKQAWLRNKLNYFNDTVQKRIYLSGPKQVLNIKNIITEECAWKGKTTDFVRSSIFELPKREAPAIYLVNDPTANQAQVRIGRTLNKDEIKYPERLALASGFMGGGFTALLMKELRIKSGLTYSAYSYASGQKDYGRLMAMSFTKIETISKLIEKMKETFEKAGANQFENEDLELARGYLMGSYPFGFERSGKFISKLLQQDHEGRAYQEIVDFPAMIAGIDRKQVAESIKSLYDWNKQVIVVLGPKSIKQELEKFGKVKVISYEDYL